MDNSRDADALSRADTESLVRDHLDHVYRVVDQMIRKHPHLEWHRDEMLDAGMGERGIYKAVKDFDTERCNLFPPFARRVIRQAVGARLKQLGKATRRTITVGLDDEQVEQRVPSDVSLDEIDENGVAGHDKVYRDCRKPAPADPLEELIAAETRDLIEQVADPELYEAIVEYRQARRCDKAHVLQWWADRLGYNSTEALRKALERERIHIQRMLGDDFFD